VLEGFVKAQVAAYIQALLRLRSRRIEARSSVFKALLISRRHVKAASSEGNKKS
jgi:hypothetical protein